MSPITLAVALAVGVLVWWLFARLLTAKSWERQGDADDLAGIGALPFAPQRIGLWIFLAVVTSFFALFMSAYSIRMNHGDWIAVTEPKLLWGNTVVLILSSVALHWARWGVSRGQVGAAKLSLLLAGLLAFAFLAGQLMAWQQLNTAGYFIRSNPATAFFYILTALHGLHLLGGLWVWARTTLRITAGAELIDVRMSVELCSVYWHYLLLVWLVLFALLLST